MRSLLAPLSFDRPRRRPPLSPAPGHRSWSGPGPADATFLAVGLLLALLWLVPLVVAVPAGATEPTDGDDQVTRALPLKIVPAGVDEVHLLPTGDDGADSQQTYAYRVEYRDGRVEIISPDEFAKLLYTEYYGRNRFFALLNITSPIGIAWVGLGLLGQVLFTGRMLVQWLASERHRRSVVPVAFWWMSLGGATMLIIYFVWRKDIVGVLGQATGWLIYVRNLRLIYRSAGALPDPSEATEATEATEAG